MKPIHGILLGAAVALMTACGGPPSPGQPAGAGGKGDGWDSENDPRHFSDHFEYRFDKLAARRSGSSQVIPWPDTYWPLRQDGYNQRWQGPGTLSPVEKYDVAFNRWVPPANFFELRPFSQPGEPYDPEYYAVLGPAARWGHEVSGNLKVMDGQPHNGTDPWHGLQDWEGHCHAWSPTSIMEPEPQHAVDMGGARFEVADIKALLEATWEHPLAEAIGDSCDSNDPARDADGRVIDPACRDTNAGAFHVVTVNMLGILGRAFIIDVSPGREVWNQPVRGYEITLQEEVALADALALLHVPAGTEYPFNPLARRFVHVQMNLAYVVEGVASTQPLGPRIDDYTRTARYDYLLELDAAGTVIGGEWIAAERHPDFMWVPTGRHEYEQDVWYWGGKVIDHQNLARLLERSRS